jgi:hypothetical protein
MALRRRRASAHGSKTMFASMVDAARMPRSGSPGQDSRRTGIALHIAAKAIGIFRSSDVRPRPPRTEETQADRGGRFRPRRGRRTVPAFGPVDQQSEDRAIRTAKALATKHVGVIAWSRDIDPALGDYGPPTTLFVSGDVPDME